MYNEAINKICNNFSDRGLTLKVTQFSKNQFGLLLVNNLKYELWYTDGHRAYLASIYDFKDTSNKNDYFMAFDISFNKNGKKYKWFNHTAKQVIDGKFKLTAQQ